MSNLFILIYSVAGGVKFIKYFKGEACYNTLRTSAIDEASVCFAQRSSFGHQCGAENHRPCSSRFSVGVSPSYVEKVF
jgi:hypothetical protein